MILGFEALSRSENLAGRHGRAGNDLPSARLDSRIVRHRNRAGQGLGVSGLCRGRGHLNSTLLNRDSELGQLMEVTLAAEGGVDEGLMGEMAGFALPQHDLNLAELHER
jgi:hypothetical protein